MNFNYRTIVFALTAALIVTGGYMSLKPAAERAAGEIAVPEHMEGIDIGALAGLEPAAGGDVAQAPAAAEADTAQRPEEAAVPMVPVTLPEERRTHILENHRNGAGVACKSEFPKGWSDEKIIEAVQKMAANDNAGWEQQGNGYFVGEGPVEDITLRVVVDREDDTIVTGYPISVERNPCPAPANDNTPQEK